MSKKILLVVTVILTSMILSCSSTSVGKSKFSPYYFYTDTNKYLFEISRYELSKLITFDRLAYKGSYIDDREMTKEDLENIKDNRNVKNRKITH